MSLNDGKSNDHSKIVVKRAANFLKFYIRHLKLISSSTLFDITPGNVLN